MKKIIALLLALIFVLSAVACSDSGEKKGDNTDTTTVEVGTDTGVLSYAGLPSGLDYGGYEFTALMRDNEKWITDMFAEESEDDRVDDAVYRRNLAVMEALKIGMQYEKSSNWNYETDAIDTIKAGTDAYDLIVPHARAAFVYANEGILLDWNDLEYIDLERDYWDQSARSSFSINNRLYVMDGDISYQCTGATCALLFNKKMTTDLGLEYPYQKVLDNEWDYDAFLKYAEAARKDMNGDTVTDIENDRYGYSTSSYGGPIQILYTAGQTILSKDEDDIPYISIDAPETVEVLEWFYAMEGNNTAYIFKELSAEEAIKNLTAKDVFKDNRVLFIDINITDVKELRDSDVEFGIIPWPKMNSQYKEYFTNVDAGTNLFIVPFVAEDPSRTSAILEALCAEGHRYVVPEYYETALKTKYSRDDESAEMLDIICRGRVFDLGYFNYYMIGEMGNGLIAFLNTNDRNFASWYKKYESITNRILKKTLKVYGVED